MKEGRAKVGMHPHSNHIKALKALVHDSCPFGFTTILTVAHMLQTSSHLMQPLRQVPFVATHREHEYLWLYGTHLLACCEGI